MSADRRAARRLSHARRVVEELCSPACAGRLTGSPGGAEARRQILGGFRDLGLSPAGEDAFEGSQRSSIPNHRGAGGAGRGGREFLQPLPVGGANILAKVEGRGPKAARAVILGAHYDHLGPATGGQAYWGAGDNAAAIWVLLDVAAQLRAREHELERQVIIAAFDAEEPPFFLGDQMGSQHFVRHPTVRLDLVDLMICLDLVGHAVGRPDHPHEVRRSLFALGAERSLGTAALLDRAAGLVSGLHLRRLNIDVIPPLSDYYAFQAAGVPSLFFTGGRWPSYHQVTDTPDGLDYPRLVATADLMVEVVIAASRRNEPSVGYLPEGRDDAGTLETLDALALLLEPSRPEATMARRALARLTQRLEGGSRLPEEDRGLLAMLAAGLESALT